MPIDELLRGSRNRRHLKARLIRAGLLLALCAECGIRSWRGHRLAPRELHHVNGDGADNRLENLTLLCPNCHSQTDSWGGRNNRRANGAQRAAG
jgi:5-methylcytosine-specific restriction endonuclease McrA